MRRDLLTIFQLGAGFALIFSAFNSQGLIEVAVLRKKAETQPETGITKNSGFYSLSIIYCFFTVFNIFIPSVVKKVGSKWSQVIGATGYLLFMLTFLYLNVYLLYISSAALGAAAALLWAGNGCYLVEASRKNKMERNSGIMWAMLQSSLITGGCFLAFVLRSGDLASSFNLIYVVFSSVIALGILFLLFLPSQPALYGAQNEEISHISEEPLLSDDMEDDVPTVSIKNQIYKTIQMIFSSEMLCLSVAFVFSGLEMTFYSGVYTSCLEETLLLKNVSDLVIPYNALSIGAGQIAGGLLTGTLGKILRIRSQHIVVAACFCHVVAFSLSYLSLPFDATIHSTDAPTYLTPNLQILLTISFLLGISDAFWQTQIYVAIGERFKQDPVNAFAIFKFFQSFAASVSFFYSSFLFLSTQIVILVISCFMATVLFLKSGIQTTNIEQRID